MDRRLVALSALLALAACKKADEGAAADSTAVPRDSFAVVTPSARPSRSCTTR
jgi:hypothetical protein